MSRKITTASELNALPVGSVVLGADLPDVPRRPLGERISPRWDPDARWNVDGRHYYGAAETVLAVLGGAATVLHDPSAPSVVSDAAGLGDRIAALSARLAAVGFPTCTCHPGDDDSERCLPRPQDWRADIERAALSSTTPTAAPSATRDEVRDEIAGHPIGSGYYATSVGVDEAAEIADALLARFTMTPKEDR